MITFAACTPDTAAPEPRLRAVVPTPMSGPGRADCVVASLARDMQDIVAVRGGVEPADLLACGWLPEELDRHHTQALGYMRAHAL